MFITIALLEQSLQFCYSFLQRRNLVSITLPLGSQCRDRFSVLFALQLKLGNLVFCQFVLLRDTRQRNGQVFDQEIDKVRKG